MASRVAIIGAGPSGLSVLQAFASAKAKGAEIPDIVCYEKQADWGGLWNYSWRTGLDEYGEPIHAGMYRYLWSNGPKECLEFADYSFEDHFGKAIPSFPPRAVLQNYILGRAEKSGLRALVKFSTPVKWVSYSPDSGKFTVVAKDLRADETIVSEFDYVIVASGHFSTPNVPAFPGLATFPGRVLHAHDFRSADEFAGKDVVVVGASYSAEDVGLQCYKYGAKSVTFTWRTRPMAFKWPEGCSEIPLLEKLEGKTAHFQDGSTRDVDAIILCTGYLHHFPFLEDSLRLKTRNRLYPPNLYKGTFWLAHPKLAYIGMHDQFYTFNMFDAQSWYARDVILDRIKMPGAEAMAADAQKWSALEEKVADPIEAIDFQTEYVRDLLTASDYPPLDVDHIAKLFKEWEHDKGQDILTYRDKAFPSVITGTLSPMHHTPWIEAMDDSLASFLGSPTVASAA